MIAKHLGFGETRRRGNARQRRRRGQPRLDIGGASPDDGTDPTEKSPTEKKVKTEDCEALTMPAIAGDDCGDEVEQQKDDKGYHWFAPMCSQG
jgi:hypothetical protein